MSKIVEQYWSAVARRLQEEVDTFNKLIGHAGEQGRENELSLVRLMENLLPTSVGVGSGMIIDSYGGVSKQTDIVIYNSADQPSILAQTTQAIFPVENVMMTIEVKTTLDEDEIADCVAKGEAQRSLRTATGKPAPPMMVLAYNAATMISTVASHLRKIDKSLRPEAMCIVNPGVLAGAGSLIKKMDPMSIRSVWLPCMRWIPPESESLKTGKGRDPMKRARWRLGLVFPTQSGGLVLGTTLGSLGTLGALF
ncbi:DUF6602 domain-containing protein [Streptomyces sp. NPDC057249]|uniref:DUF6602 domain-containing protein n=1 Tax=Streptomyces sp. NPDC057249 TaxID=3346067 RepID=UPI003634265A